MNKNIRHFLNYLYLHKFTFSSVTLTVGHIIVKHKGNTGIAAVIFKSMIGKSNSTNF